MSRKFFIGIFVIFLLPSLAAGETITLQKALEMATAQNPALKQKQGELRAARGQKIIQGSLLPSNPEVEGEIKTDRFFAGHGEGELSLGVSQEVEIAGQTFSRHSVAKADYERAKEEFRNFQLITQTETETAFFSLLYQQKKKTLLDQMAAQQGEITAGAKKAVGSGVIPQFDYDLLQAENASLLALDFQAKNELNDASLRFKEVLGLPQERDVNPAEETPNLPSLLAKEELLAHALQNQPGLVAARWNERARRKESLLKAQEFVPNPKLFFRYSRDKAILEDNNGGEIIDRDKFFTFGASIPLPVTGKSRGAYVKAKGEQAAAQSQVEATSLTVQRLIGDAYVRYQNLQESISQYAVVMERAEQNINLLHKAYLQGRITLDSFLVKRERFLNAVVNYYDSRINLMKTKADLEIALGTRLVNLQPEGEKP